LYYLRIALYHHPYPGQIEAPLYTQDYIVKRPRLENKLPLYPQRPGEKDCAHYMMTRTCKYGETCKFDHPIWVPQGGLPDWKEVILLNYYFNLFYHTVIIITLITTIILLLRCPVVLILIFEWDCTCNISYTLK
jgi:Zinc finger C-x8-C-x5-C-x3-H type (and similar)